MHVCVASLLSLSEPEGLFVVIYMGGKRPMIDCYWLIHVHNT